MYSELQFDASKQYGIFGADNKINKDALILFKKNLGKFCAPLLMSILPLNVYNFCVKVEHSFIEAQDPGCKLFDGDTLKLIRSLN